ncbi:ESX-1 secretion-associated protein [Micromonospora ureilytica]|uniref:ESX-1 secretion-associated protein n=1 Tax=Micromonospora ureilytica TaxID=709868 RepID=A0A3N9Y0C8_9ACTN|nr:type VII secretion target [Micromonospora ureilytica]RQX18650.1 ESX-1 secretion-associated protein [Micromonospora ureilytica]WSG34660.1 ESX-1 secretion-associated protein [Micromonospora ureilytica]
MTNGDGFQVDPDDLSTHAAHIERNADGLDTARQAGQHIQLSADAYGQLCAIMPLLLDGLQRTLVDGIADAAGSVRDTSEKLRANADRYRASDASAEQLLRQTRG